MTLKPCCQCEEDHEADDLGECEECGELVCIECMKHSSGPHECIDYTICLACYENVQRDRQIDGDREYRARKARNARARARYNSPAARAKRAAKKAAAKKLKAQRAAEARERIAKELSGVMAEFSRFF